MSLENVYYTFLETLYIWQCLKISTLKGCLFTQQFSILSSTYHEASEYMASELKLLGRNADEKRRFMEEIGDTFVF